MFTVCKCYNMSGSLGRGEGFYNVYVWIFYVMLYVMWNCYEIIDSRLDKETLELPLLGLEPATISFMSVVYPASIHGSTSKCAEKQVFGAWSFTMRLCSNN